MKVLMFLSVKLAAVRGKLKELDGRLTGMTLTLMPGLACWGSAVCYIL